MKDPVFRDKINDIVNARNSGKLTAKEATAAIETAQVASEAKTQDPEVAEIKKSLIEQNVQRYVDTFQSKAKTDGFSDKDDLEILEQLTTKYLLAANPNAPKRFSQSEMDDAYGKAKDKMEGYAKRKTSSYVKEKVAEQPPVTKTGTAGTVSHDVMGHAEQTKFVAQALKARKSSGE